MDEYNKGTGLEINISISLKKEKGKRFCFVAEFQYLVNC